MSRNNMGAPTQSLVQLAKQHVVPLPEVLAWTLSDVSGAVTDGGGDLDGESAAAVWAVAAGALGAAGEQLGMGVLQRATLVGPGTTCLVIATEDEVLTVYGRPPKPLAFFEKKLEAILP